MPVTDAIMPHLPVFGLVLSRLTGLFVLAPLVSGLLLPARYRALLAAALALAIYPTLNHPVITPPSLALFSLLPAMGGELLIGAGIGVIAVVPIMTAQLAGQIMSQQMGLSLAGVLNPMLDMESDGLSQALFFGAMASFVSLGGVESIYTSLISTFSHVPLGSLSAGDAPLEPLLGVIGSGFEVALRVSMPVLIILLVESIAAGFLMKTVPSLNIMNVGFPARILLGMLAVISGFALMMSALVGDVARGLETAADWAASL